MPITYVNAKEKTYYLHQGVTKTGKPKYHFAMKSEGNLADAIPEEYEIYENPNAQVFLCRIPPKLITDEERQVVEDGMRAYSDAKDYKIDVKGNTIAIYTADQDFDRLVNIACNPHASVEENEIRMRLIRESIHYSDILKFILEDDQHRTFMTQRYCFLGSIDDWIYIGKPDMLSSLVKKYVKHIDKESFYELM
ncbi:MAG: hypothetical protein ETSY2_03125 [Candidatus Entotheonella gemina]|uniref:Uncharacterized protein n=1 Tax=Candidatus Entotheonella gemina TaxID=1429439 RepID=W4MET4_9BACT|nr:MAG: hypothetical protein ETSY2_03125 [Candidatus Entotheonella gemina]